MKRKLFAILFVFFSFYSYVFADSEPETVDSNELPQAVYDLRRFEIITLGSLPFVTMDVNLAYSSYKWATNDFRSDYFPNPFASSEKRGYSTDEQIGVLISSVCISVGIGLTDLIINTIKRNNQKQKMNRDYSRDITITPIEQDPDAVIITPPVKTVDNWEE